ncbi:hypothetical protein J1N35_001417, partial [Gossypium stocksii]
MTDFDGRVKMLPNLETPNRKINDDIDELKVLIDIIINYSFGFVIRDYNNFRLPAKLVAFLSYLDSKFLESDERRCKSIYIEYTSNWLFIMDPNGRVKILPNLDTPNNNMKDDIDKLKVLMDFIINYPLVFVIRDYNQCRLPAKLEAFLGYLDSKFFKMKDDIDELKVLMDFVINYSFESVIQDYNQCRLLAKLEAFLGYLDPKF